MTIIQNKENHQLIKLSEDERLKNLHAYQILDTPAEEEFDNLTSLASSICQSKIALVSFIDQDRQFYKSSFGELNSQIAKSERFLSCEAIKYPKEIYTINNIQEHPDLKTNPILLETPHIKFYAGVPLISKKGYALGTLCVMNDQPKQLDKEQINALKKLAYQVILLIEARKKTQLVRDCEFQKNQHVEFLKDIIFTLIHDLKSPISSLSELISFFKSEYSNILDKQALVYIDYAIESNEKLLHIINSTSEFAKQVNIIDNLEEVDLNQVIDEVSLLYKTDLKRFNIKLEYENLPRLVSSKNALDVICRNLINNAIKYRSSKRDLVISISAEDKNNYWTLQFNDNGIGIAPEKQTEIFQLFKRMHTDQNGKGIGLALCKKIVLNLGGIIDIKSKMGEGSTFLIKLPKNR